MLTIPGLPTDWVARDGTTMDLSVVPAAPTSENDPDRAKKVKAWSRWGSEVFRYRRIRKIECRDPVQQKIEREKCRRYGPKYVITMWCWVNEPRKRRFSEVWDKIAPPGEEPEHPGWLPAIPFPFQIALLDWFEARLAGTGADANGIISKPRDMGASWWICLAMMSHFLFDGQFSGKFISRREDEVDKTGKLNCLMGRLSCHIVTNRWPACTFPAFLRPSGWVDSVHRQQLQILHPENENIFSGESTSSRSGRGDRSDTGLVDEAAHIPELRELIGALSQTVDHLILISSEYVGTTDHWGEYIEAMQRINPDSVLELEWWMHPFHDQTYLDQERERMQDDEAFAREILRDRYAGTSGWLYELARDIEPLEVIREHQEGTIHVCGFDPGQDDETALASVMLDSAFGRDTVLEAYARRGKTPEWWAALILGCDPDDPALEEYHLQFTIRERELAEWFRSIPQPVIYGDPYGDNSPIRKGQTYYNEMRIFALKHNPRKDEDGQPLPLVIICGTDNDQRHFQQRRLKTMSWLPRVDWNPIPDVIKTLHAIKNSKFDDPDKARQAEQKDAKHDGLSHRRTSIEFVAVNLEIAYRFGVGRNAPYRGDAGTRTTKVRELPPVRDEQKQRVA
jgi:hypothetical protein